MDWLSQVGNEMDEVENLRAEIARKNQELNQLRSTSHQQHNRAEQQQNILRGQIEDGKVPDADEDLNNWDWNKIAGVAKEKKETNKVSADGDEVVTGMTRKQLDDLVQRRIQKNEQAKAQHAVQAQQTQAQLQEQFFKEHPELIDHASTVHRLWNQSMQLNPNIDAKQRFQGVVHETKAILNEYGLLKDPKDTEQLKRQQVNQMNPYLGGNPLAVRDVGRPMPERVEYNQDAHAQEIQKRRESIASKMFG